MPSNAKPKAHEEIHSNRPRLADRSLSKGLAPGDMSSGIRASQEFAARNSAWWHDLAGNVRSFFCTSVHRFAQTFAQNLIDGAKAKIYLARRLNRKL
jgi:hypothetical protein